MRVGCRMRTDCADHAVAFACGVPVQLAKACLSHSGRPANHDGTTDKQIAYAVRACGREPVVSRHNPRTVRTFAREGRDGSFILFTCDHVVACVNGFLCDRPENSDLARIEKVWKII